MNIYEVMVMTTFVMVTIICISQYIDSNTPRVSDVLQLMNVLPCYKVQAYKNGRRLKTSELIQHIKSPVKGFEMTEGILYIEI